MAGGVLSGNIKRGETRLRTLRTILRDTQRALDDVNDVLSIDPEIQSKVYSLSVNASQNICLIVLGSDCITKARFVNCILGENILPVDINIQQWKWVRFSYGSTKQAHLTLGNPEFEIVEDLECNQNHWNVLPIKDLRRNNESELNTILDVELNNSLLRDGIKIIIPPNIHDTSATNNINEYKKIYEEFYEKRKCVLQNCLPVYFYALNKIGKCLNEDFYCGSRRSSDMEVDQFCSVFNLSVNSSDSNVVCNKDDNYFNCLPDGSVFTVENYLDLQQAKELHPKQQIYFVLFSDSTEIEGSGDEWTTAMSSPAGHESEATESLENDVYVSTELPESDRELQVLSPSHKSIPIEHTSRPRRKASLQTRYNFMCDLIDQWDLLYGSNSKSSKDDWFILDERSIFDSLDNSDNQSPTSKRMRKPRSQQQRAEYKNKMAANRHVLVNKLSKYIGDAINCHLLESCTKLSEIHVRLLQQFILTSFDMAREIQVVPIKTQYVSVHEQQLYESIVAKFSQGEKKQELVSIMENLLEEMRNEVNNMNWAVDEHPSHQDISVSNSIFYNKATVTIQPKPNHASREENSDAEEATDCNIDEYDVIDSSDESLSTFDNNVQVGSAMSSSSKCLDKGSISVKQAHLDVQKLILNMLSRKITLKLINFMDCLHDSYFGTLQRCLESLEECCRNEVGGRPSQAVSQLLDAARSLDLQPAANISLLRTLIDSLRRFFYRLGAGGGNNQWCCPLSAGWRRSAALNTLYTITPHTLARIISQQILERVVSAHERFQTSLGSLQTALSARLHHTEDTKLMLRKQFAPNFARLCLESTSLCDLLKYGVPELLKEIGRGQYGVVYGCKSWGGRGPCAVKSVLPNDRRHYNDLAMEFFYTRSIPEHPRIVRLWGAIVERGGGGGGGGSKGVLLVSRRMKGDLYCALRADRLTFTHRMRIAIDIVEGIRYLHSLGLVHRDIKLKNVLLDKYDRASLSDLGFCSSRTLLSGSLVGTPVHMAPELLKGDYGFPVDVFAFAVLFWYLCAGTTRQPSAFETIQNKEQLWGRVKKGLRPERLPSFTDECWNLMTTCWASEPSERALLGDVQPILEGILQRSIQDDNSRKHAMENHESDSGDSLGFTFDNYDIV